MGGLGAAGFLAVLLVVMADAKDLAGFGITGSNLTPSSGMRLPEAAQASANSDSAFCSSTVFRSAWRDPGSTRI